MHHPRLAWGTAERSESQPATRGSSPPPLPRLESQLSRGVRCQAPQQPPATCRAGKGTHTERRSRKRHHRQRRRCQSSPQPATTRRRPPVYFGRGGSPGRIEVARGRGFDSKAPSSTPRLETGRAAALAAKLHTGCRLAVHPRSGEVGGGHWGAAAGAEWAGDHWSAIICACRQVLGRPLWQCLLLRGRSRLHWLTAGGLLRPQAQAGKGGGSSLPLAVEQRTDIHAQSPGQRIGLLHPRQVRLHDKMAGGGCRLKPRSLMLLVRPRTHTLPAWGLLQCVGALTASCLGAPEGECGPSEASLGLSRPRPSLMRVTSRVLAVRLCWERDGKGGSAGKLCLRNKPAAQPVAGFNGSQACQVTQLRLHVH